MNNDKSNFFIFLIVIAIFMFNMGFQVGKSEVQKQHIKLVNKITLKIKEDDIIFQKKLKELEQEITINTKKVKKLLGINEKTF